MVAIRGLNGSYNTLSHPCGNHVNQPQHNAQRMQTPMNMSQSAVAQHMNANPMNLQTHNNVSMQFLQQQNSHNPIKHEQSSSRFSNSNCMPPSHQQPSHQQPSHQQPSHQQPSHQQPSHPQHHYRLIPQATHHSYPRASTPHRPVDCYHPAGATGAGYMPSSAGGAQPGGQPPLRVQPPPQPSAPPAPPQDMSKNTMGGHNYVAPQNQSPQTRPQYGGNFQYRPTQHATRPNTHPRQQQQFVPNPAAPSGAGTMMYHPVVFQSMGMQTYQQPRSNNQAGYYPYMAAAPYLSYSNTPSHTSSPYFYTSNNQPLPTPNIQANAPGSGRSNPANLVGPQGTPATPAAPAATLPHPPAPTHMHQNITGVRPSVPPTKRPSYRIAIINPLTKQDIFSEIVNNNDNNQYMGGDTSGRQTPQQEQQQHPTHSVAEEFARKVNEVANQPTSSEIAAKIKCVDLPISSSIPKLQPQINTITSINNSNIGKSEIVPNNETKNLGPDIAVTAVETPVVSAISNSPVIVPKMPKQQKSSEPSIQSFILDTNKVPTSKQNKHKNKPFVPQVEDIEKPTETILRLPESGTPLITQVSACPVTALPLASMSISTPATMSASTKTISSLITPHFINSMPAPQPQRVREHRSRIRLEDKEKSKEKDFVAEKEVFGHKANGPTQPAVTSSVDSLKEVINPLTSQSSINIGAEAIKRHNIPKQFSFPLQTDNLYNAETKTETLKSNKVPAVAHSNKTPATHSNKVPPVAHINKVAPVAHSNKVPPVAHSNKVPPVDHTTTATAPVAHTPTATELLSASIEKFARGHTETPEPPEPESEPIKREFDSAIEAQVKLTQSLASCLRASQPETKMKDFNLNNKATDPDTANGNAEITKPEAAKEDLNKNEKTVKNNKIKIAANEMATDDNQVTETESYENGKDETDKISSIEQDVTLSTQEDEEVKPLPEETVDPVATPAIPPAPPVFVPKYKYSDDQWSPLNKSGKKCYDIGLLKQIKEDPLSKNKPNVPLLEAWNIIRTAPMQEPIHFAAISRPMNDSLTQILPSFAKGTGGMGPRSNTPRDPKKDGRNIIPSGKNSIKLAASQSGNSSQKQVIHVSLSLREEVKLNQVDSAWKPSRLRKENTTEEDCKTQEVYKKFRGILNKLTPQKFDTLLERVKTLEITNQKRLEGVIDLVFEKAIDEPNFSEAYAAMCNKLSTLKVPAENATNPDQRVNFRALIISRCQKQFEAHKADENVIKLEKEVSECTDPTKKKELQLQLAEENRRARMRSVGNVRFIGELYKLKMLTHKIMVYCMNHLIDKLEEEKLECLCKLLTTIGEQVESEVKDQLDLVFKKMQNIVDRKSNSISSRVRFMIQDVIELRRRRWVLKSVVDSQPKTMDQIQKEHEQQQRNIELMNASPMGNFRRDDGGRGKRNDGRRQGSNSFMDNSSSWKTPRNSYTVDTSKLKAGGAATPKNLSSIKLAPINPGWTQGSGTKNTAQAASNSMISLTKNMYGILENSQTDPSSLRANKDMTPAYHSKGASIERSTFSTRADFSTNSGSASRSGSVRGARSNSGSRSASTAPPTPPATEVSVPTATSIPQEPLPDNKKKSIKSTLDLYLLNRDDDELVTDVKQLFPPEYHAGVVTEILNVALEMSAKDVQLIAKALSHLITTQTISADSYVSGLKEIFELAPDLYIDIPMLYDYLGKFLAPQIEKKHITLKQIFRHSESIISSNQGHLLLKVLIKELKDSMGPTFVKSKWQESEYHFKDWMNEDQVAKWTEENKLEFLEGDTTKASDESSRIMTPVETQKKILQLMNADESFDCIKGWVQDILGKSSNEDWFMRALIQAICEHALFGAEGRDVPHFNQERMNKYAGLINEFGESKEAREASCLFGIQQLIHRLEHPQGLTLEIFQYLNDQYIITVDGFIAWEESEKEPEGKGVMMKALTSFFTNIKEADNEDSCSED